MKIWIAFRHAHFPVSPAQTASAPSAMGVTPSKTINAWQTCPAIMVFVNIAPGDTISPPMIACHVRATVRGVLMTVHALNAGRAHI